MTVVVGILLPLAVFVSMGAVGLGLAPEDFRRLATLRLGVALGLAAPILLLPLLAVVLAKGLALPPAVAGGLLLLSAAPPAAISSLYVGLGRANTALCVALTALATLVCIFTMPLAMSIGFNWLALAGTAIRVPVLATMGQLILLLIFPAGLGMMVRARRPAFAMKVEGTFKLCSLFNVLVLLFVVVWLQWRTFQDLMAQVILSALLFTLAAGAVGYLLGILAGSSLEDRFVIAMNCSTRSFGIAATVGATFMGRTDFLALMAAFFLIHAALATSAVVWFRTFVPQTCRH